MSAARTVVITGASGGLGLELARWCADRGDRLVLNSRTVSSELAALLERDRDRICHVAGDIAAEETSQRIAQAAGAAGSGDLAVISNAGLSDDSLTVSTSAERWNRTLAVNLTGAFLLTKHMLRPMMRRRYGRFAYVGSIAATHGNPGQVAYSASKAGLHGLTMTVAQEYARYGVRTVTVEPGPLPVGIGSRMGAQGRAKLLAHSLQPHVETESTVAVLGFLTTRQADYLNATTIELNGGIRYGAT